MREETEDKEENKKIMLVEDQSILLDAFAMALETEKDFAVIAKILDPDLSLLACAKYHPDVVLMDICANDDTSGFLAAKRIKEHYPNIKVIMITGMPEITFIHYAKEIGVDGFLYKSMKFSEIVSYIRDVLAGKDKFEPEKVETQLFLLNKEIDWDKFTKREIGILRLLCDGYVRSEIAKILDISENTVKVHQTRILGKSGFTKMSKLVCHVTQKGLLHPKMKQSKRDIMGTDIDEEER